MNAKRYLIVNADDFGQSPGVNCGIIKTHEQGIVTSTGLMVRWPAAPEAAHYARTHPSLSVGLHLDLCEFIYRDGVWVALYEVVPLDDAAAVAREVTRQLEAFCDLVGRPPTHIDSHQHVHVREPVRSPAAAAARRLGVPLRGCTPSIRYCGAFYGQTAQGSPLHDFISAEKLLAILSTLPAGITELSCHPGLEADLDTMYSSERKREVDVLCDPRIRLEIHLMGIALCSFGHQVLSSLPALPPPGPS